MGDSENFDLPTTSALGGDAFTIVKFDPEENLDHYFHRPGQISPIDFLCLDARGIGVGPILSQLEAIDAFQSERPEGFMPPCVVVTCPDQATPEELRSIAERGAYFVESPNGCEPELAVRCDLDEQFAQSTAAMMAGKGMQSALKAHQTAGQTVPTAELAPFLYRPEGFDAATLGRLYQRSRTPDSPTKDE